MIEDSCGTHLSGDQATHETVVARSPDFRRKDLVLVGLPVLFESMVGVALQWVGRYNEGVASDPWEKTPPKRYGSGCSKVGTSVNSGLYHISVPFPIPLMICRLW